MPLNIFSGLPADQNLAGAHREGDRRATGWKIPLIFCAIIIAAVGVAAFLRIDKRPVPALPEPLVEQARQITINLDQDEASKKWKERITAAAGGFVSRADKDVKIAYLIRLAVAEQRYDAACTAAVLMYNAFQRDEMLGFIRTEASAHCATLPWGAIAAKGMTDKEGMITAHEALTTRWLECGGTIP